MNYVLTFVLIAFSQYSFGDSTDVDTNDLGDSEATRSLLIVFSEKWAPLSYLDDSGKIQGILPNMAREIIQVRLGVAVEFRVYPWKRAQVHVQAGYEDGLFAPPTKERLQYLKSSEESLFHLQRVMLISKTTQNYNKMKNLDDVTSGENFSYIGINGDSSTEEFYKKYGLSFNPVSTVAQAVEMLAAGRVDAFVHFRANGLLKINQDNLQDKVELHPKKYDLVNFNLLISDSYKPREILLKRADQLMKQMKASGEFQLLLDRIIIEEVDRVIESGN